MAKNGIKRKDSNGRVLYVGESERKDGTYMYRYTDHDGVRRTVYANCLKTLRGKEKEIERNLDDNICCNINLTVNQLIERYLDTKTNISIGTRNNYVDLWNRHIYPDKLGKQKVTGVKKSQVLKFYSDLKKAGYSDGTIHNINSFLYPAFELAVDDDMIRKNPCKGCLNAVKTGDAKEKTSLTRVQQERFLEYVNNSTVYKKYYPMFYIMIKTACRIGEAIGLTFDDIDYKNKQLKIDHQVIYKKVGDRVQYYITTPKTKKGIRTLYLTPDVEEQFRLQEKLLFKSGVDRSYELDGYKNFIFLNKHGRPIQPNALRRALCSIVEEYNEEEAATAAMENRDPELLPHISPHTLRHTGCTRMSEDGVSNVALQYIMGHASPVVTNIYNHVDLERVTKEMLKISAV